MTNTPNMAANTAASSDSKPAVATPEVAPMTPAHAAPATPDTKAAPAAEPAKKV